MCIKLVNYWDKHMYGQRIPFHLSNNKQTQVKKRQIDSHHEQPVYKVYTAFTVPVT